MPEAIKLHFLGTGSMIPDAKRGHPAFLLTYGAENILIDCGEGTQIQFRKAHLNPCKVTKILITHWHGVHTFGLPGFLRTLATSGYKKKLEIYGPYGFKKHMGEMFRAFGGINEYEISIHEINSSGKFFESSGFFLESEKMIHVQPCNSYNFIAKGHSRIDKIKMKKLKLPQGEHLQKLKSGKDITINGKKFKAKDILFREDDRKISFVMDTKINKKIVPFVKDAEVLVSEATFGKGDEKLAEAYQHLTAEQAAMIAKKANVKKLYITHLSARNDGNLKEFLADAKKIFPETFLANELMEIDM